MKFPLHTGGFFASPHGPDGFSKKRCKPLTPQVLFIRMEQCSSFYALTSMREIGAAHCPRC
jgi:hypothetical protein